ncbi:hypothetical protein F441_01924 [Phytophthora nicotianae CJ01A1]|uniref:Uncharacterized protein n=1 Tax=Phytophthora nicotianae CJ01A1 TaxID=1317063 RepID=W2XRZ9_PHYNI|nr:hypothetical protein F441_01924 [Phytophthora nicotianae CJ01A1]
MKEVGLLLRVPKNTASRLWKRAKNNAALYGVYEAPFMKRKCGRRPLDLSSALEQPPRRRVAALCIREGGQNTYNFAHMSEAKLRRMDEHVISCRYYMALFGHLDTSAQAAGEDG